MTPERRNVHDYSIEDDDSPDTAAIRAALDDYTGGGDEVYLSPGTYRSTPLCINDDTVFRLANGTELQFVQGFTESPTVGNHWKGWDQGGFHPCLHMADVSNATVTGEGVISGGDSCWWVLVLLPPEQCPPKLATRPEEI